MSNFSETMNKVKRLLSERQRGVNPHLRLINKVDLELLVANLDAIEIQLQATDSLVSDTLMDNNRLTKERDALAANNSRLSEKLIAINLYCQKNNIGEWGASASEALIAQCDALVARNNELIGLILRMRDRWWPFVHGSVCPSNTAYNLGKESADIISKTPQQCLRDVQAEAGRAGFVACAEFYGLKVTYASKEGIERASNQYAATVRNDGMQNGNSQKTEETELQKAIRLLNGEWPENQWSSKRYIYLIHMPEGGGGGYATTDVADYRGYQYICTRDEFEKEATKVR